MRMNYRGYEILIEPRPGGEGLTGRVATTRDEITFSAPDMMRLKREAESAIDFYLASCEQSGREPDSPDGSGYLTVLPPKEAKQLEEEARRRRVSIPHLIAELVKSALPNGGPTQTPATTP